MKMSYLSNIHIDYSSQANPWHGLLANIAPTNDRWSPSVVSLPKQLQVRHVAVGGAN